MENILNMVQCKICKRYFNRITHFHTLNMHNLSLNKYRRMFPDAKMEGKNWINSQINSHVGQVAWNKGETKETNTIVAQYSESISKYERTPEHCRNISIAKKQKCKENPELVSKLLSCFTRHAWNVSPNIPEQKVMAILDRYYPDEWEFIGNNAYLVGKLNPDFINKKKFYLLEVFGDYWHKDENPQRRINYFKMFGFNTVVIWEHEVDDPSIVIERISSLPSVETEHETSLFEDEDTVRSYAKA